MRNFRTVYQVPQPYKILIYQFSRPFTHATCYNKYNLTLIQTRQIVESLMCQVPPPPPLVPCLRQTPPWRLKCPCPSCVLTLQLTGVDHRGGSRPAACHDVINTSSGWRDIWLPSPECWQVPDGILRGRGEGWGRDEGWESGTGGVGRWELKKDMVWKIALPLGLSLQHQQNRVWGMNGKC